MKQLLITTLALITFLSSKAQTFPLFDPPNNFDVDGAYYKDLDGDLEKLVGTWQYTNGSQTFKIILKKKSNDTIPSAKGIIYTEDVLHGEYLYIDESNNEIINTLNDIDNYEDVSNNSIYGSYIKGKYSYPVCEDCSETERRVEVLIEDPERSYFDYEMEIRHIPEDQLAGSPEQIKIRINPGHMMTYKEGQPSDHRLPTYQDIVLEKQ